MKNSYRLYYLRLMSEYSALKLQKIALTILEENKMLIVFFRAVILYILIVISIRLMGKRQIGELQPSELVITLLLSNIATLPIEDMTIPMSMGIVPIFTLVCLDVILSHCSLKFRGLRKLICGSPKIVVSRGIIDQKQLKDLRFSADDLLESLRSMGIFDINEVQLAVVETTGKISVYQKAQFRPVNNGGMGVKGSQTDPPQLVVDNGRIIYSARSFVAAVPLQSSRRKHRLPI